MNVTTKKNPVRPHIAAAKAEQPAPKEYQIKSEKYDLADRFEESREFGNQVAGLAVGTVGGAVDGVVKALPVTYEIVENLWQTEKVGINLKILGTVAAPIGGALSAVAGPIVGAVRGMRGMKEAQRSQEGPLTQDASVPYTDKKFSGETKSFSSDIIEDLEEMGAAKLEEGEKPFDIPITNLASSVIGGVVSAGIMGVAGAVVGLAAGVLTGGKEIAGALNPFSAEKQSLGKRTGRVFAGALTSVALPYGLLKENLIGATVRGFKDGYNHNNPLKPVSDTIKATAELSGEVLKEAWNK